MTTALQVETSSVDDLIEKSLEEADDQIAILEGVPPGTAYREARMVERAVENLAVLADDVKQAILQLMWRMERDLLYVELGHASMLEWALSNPTLQQRWSSTTIHRYATAISRVLPEVYRVPVIHPDTGEIITPEALLAQGTISAIKDYAYTFSQTEDAGDRQAMLLSILRHDSEPTRDGLMNDIRRRKTPIPPIVFHTSYTEGQVVFSGQATTQQWDVLVSLLGRLADERFTQAAGAAS